MGLSRSQITSNLSDTFFLLYHSRMSTRIRNSNDQMSSVGLNLNCWAGAFGKEVIADAVLKVLRFELRHLNVFMETEGK